MKDHSLKLGRSAKTGQFVLTAKRGEKISAVEGLKLSPRMTGIFVQASAKKLSGDERRTLIKETVRKK